MDAPDEPSRPPPGRPLARSVRQLARTIEHHARERHTHLRPSTGDPLLREYELYAAPRRARRW